MRTSETCEELKAAFVGLVSVQQGQSERIAALNAFGPKRPAQKSVQATLKVLQTTLARRDELDRIVSQALPRQLTVVEQCHARLTTWIVLYSDSGPSSEEVACLRESAPEDFRRDLEYLLGFLLTFDARSGPNSEGEVESVALRTHNLPWWVNYCFHTFGRARALNLLLNEARPRYVRVNSLRNDGKTSLPRELQGHEKFFAPVLSIPGVYKVVGRPVSLAQFIAKGILQFQDLASYCAVVAADPRPSESVLDVCAAPGAKTSALAQLMGNSGEIVSVDYSRSRVESWSREMNRLGVEIATPIVADATSLCLKEGQYDLVLLDPPCSGTGILDRNPRMKWSLSKESVARYSLLQGKMLEEAYRLVARTGRIVYSTCSVTLEEDEGVVSRFLNEHPDMESRPLSLSVDLGSEGMNGFGNCRRFFPRADGTAGYFIARLEYA